MAASRRSLVEQDAERAAGSQRQEEQRVDRFCGDHPQLRQEGAREGEKAKARDEARDAQHRDGHVEEAIRPLTISRQEGDDR
jgi:hypothetical protein